MAHLDARPSGCLLSVATHARSVVAAIERLASHAPSHALVPLCLSCSRSDRTRESRKRRSEPGAVARLPAWAARAGGLGAGPARRGAAREPGQRRRRQQRRRLPLDLGRRALRGVRVGRRQPQQRRRQRLLAMSSCATSRPAQPRSRARSPASAPTAPPPSPRSRPTGASWRSSRAPTTSAAATTTTSPMSSCATCRPSTTTLASRASAGVGADGSLHLPLDLGGRAVRGVRVHRRQPRQRRRQRLLQRFRARPAGRHNHAREPEQQRRRRRRRLLHSVDLGRRALRGVPLPRRQPQPIRGQHASPTSSYATCRRTRPRSRARRAASAPTITPATRRSPATGASWRSPRSPTT